MVLEVYNILWDGSAVHVRMKCYNYMSEEMRRADFKEKQGILIRKVCSHIGRLVSGCGVFSMS